MQSSRIGGHRIACVAWLPGDPTAGTRSSEWFRSAPTLGGTLMVSARSQRIGSYRLGFLHGGTTLEWLTTTDGREVVVAQEPEATRVMRLLNLVVYTIRSRAASPERVSGWSMEVSDTSPQRRVVSLLDLRRLLPSPEATPNSPCDDTAPTAAARPNNARPNLTVLIILV